MQRLHELLTSTPRTGDLASLVIDFGWSAAVEGIRRLAGRADPVKCERWLELSVDEVKAVWLGDARNRLAKRYVEYLVAADGKIAPFMNLLRVAPCSDAGTQANIQRILHETPRLGALPDPAGAMEELNECAKFGKLRAKAWHNDQNVYEQVRDASDGYRKVLPERLAALGGDPGNLDTAIVTGRQLRPASRAGRSGRRIRSASDGPAASISRTCWCKRATCSAITPTSAKPFASDFGSSCSMRPRTSTRCRWN